MTCARPSRAGALSGEDNARRLVGQTREQTFDIASYNLLDFAHDVEK
jgi:hypothetical protein